MHNFRLSAPRQIFKSFLEFKYCSCFRNYNSFFFGSRNLLTFLMAEWPFLQYNIFTVFCTWVRLINFLILKINIIITFLKKPLTTFDSVFTGHKFYLLTYLNLNKLESVKYHCPSIRPIYTTRALGTRSVTAFAGHEGKRRFLG